MFFQLMLYCPHSWTTKPDHICDTENQPHFANVLLGMYEISSKRHIDADRRKGGGGGGWCGRISQWIVVITFTVSERGSWGAHIDSLELCLLLGQNVVTPVTLFHYPDLISYT